MAEGWTRYLKSHLIEAYSAGLAPKGLDPRAVAVMSEVGVDISNQRSRHVSDLRHIAFDYVVTVCDDAEERCPAFPGPATVIHVGFDDPPRLARTAGSHDEILALYRRVRDEICAFIDTLPASLYLKQ